MKGMLIIKYIRIIRELEKVLELTPKPFFPSLRVGWEGRWYWVPLRFPKKPSVTELAVHEIRHRIQKEQKIKLIKLEEVKDWLFPEDIKVIQSAKISEGEKDAEIVEKIGTELLRQQRINEFRDLMLKSKVPSKL